MATIRPTDVALHKRAIDGYEGYLVWSRQKFGGKQVEGQPESLSTEKWGEIADRIDGC